MTDLGPNQIAWLKANVPQFGPAKEAADRVKAHEAEVRAVMPEPSVELADRASQPEPHSSAA